MHNLLSLFLVNFFIIFYPIWYIMVEKKNENDWNIGLKLKKSIIKSTS
jgi:cbb3-type cytochrome oxidase subunit 3